MTAELCKARIVYFAHDSGCVQYLVGLCTVSRGVVYSISWGCVQYLVGLYFLVNLVS